MKKAFLCQIPYNLPKNYCKYEAMDSKKLQIDRAVRFPLVLLVEAYASPEDEVRIVVTYNSDENLETIHALRDDLRAVQEKIGFICDLDSPTDFRAVQVDFEFHINYQKRLFLKLLDQFDDIEKIYADITIGTKPTPIVITRLLDYFQKTRPMFIGNIIYANAPRMMEGKAISSDEILEEKYTI